MKKKIFCTLMCIMIVMCFMPAMSFADQTLSTSPTLGSKSTNSTSSNDEVITVKTLNGKLAMNGYEVYRSTSKNFKNVKKPLFTTTNKSYNNTKVKNGIKYYYKVRGYVKVNGKKYYTNWSNVSSMLVTNKSKTKMKAVVSSKKANDTITITLDNLGDAMKAVTIKSSTKLVKKSNGFAGVSVSWTVKNGDVPLKSFSENEENDKESTAKDENSPSIPSQEITYYSVAHAHKYEIQTDGHWECINSGHSGSTTLLGTDKPYAAVLNTSGQPAAIVSLTANNVSATLLGSGKISKQGDVITYTNSGTSQNIVIRTEKDTTTLNIDDKTESTIKHYGVSGILNIIECHTSSLHEVGKVNFVEIAKGRLILEPTSDVEVINLKKTGEVFEEIIIADAGITEENTPEVISRDSITVTNEQGITVATIQKLDNNGDVTKEETVKAYPSESIDNSTEKTATNNSEVTSNLGMLVIDDSTSPGAKSLSKEEKESKMEEVAIDAVTEQLKSNVETSTFDSYVARIGTTGYTSLLDAISTGSNSTIVLLKDATLDVTLGDLKNIILDGDNHKLSFSIDVIPFSKIDSCKLRDLKFEMNVPSGDFLLTDTITDSSFDNVDIFGTGLVTGNVGAYAWKLYGKNSFKDCQVYATLQGSGAPSNYNSGFFGILTTDSDTTLEDCSFEGTLKCGSAALVVANPCYNAAKLTLKNVKNNGLIQGTCSTSNEYFTISNQVSAVTCDGTLTYYTLTVDDQIINCSDSSALSNVNLKGTGNFIYGPEDATLSITKNPNKTMSITAATTVGVDHYEVSIGTYVAVPNGSNRNYVTEIIDAKEALTTSIKWLDFVDKEWVTNNPSAISSTINGYTVYTLGESSYYLVTEDSFSTNGAVRELCICAVSAYNEDGLLLASASYDFTVN